jgi:hypothetical protein
MTVVEVTSERRARRWLPFLAPVVVLAVFIAIAPRIFIDPPRTDHLTLENRSQYAMDVEVTGAGRDGWLRLGTAERGTTTVLSGVLDQGDEWIFRFGAQGLDGGELRVAKAQLVRDDWHLTIPGSIADSLAKQGAPPTPPPSG